MLKFKKNRKLKLLTLHCEKRYMIGHFRNEIASAGCIHGSSALADTNFVAFQVTGSV